MVSMRSLTRAILPIAAADRAPDALGRGWHSGAMTSVLGHVVPPRPAPARQPRPARGRARGRTRWSPLFVRRPGAVGRAPGGCAAPTWRPRCAPWTRRSAGRWWSGEATRRGGAAVAAARVRRSRARRRRLRARTARARDERVGQALADRRRRAGAHRVAVRRRPGAGAQRLAARRTRSSRPSSGPGPSTAGAHPVDPPTRRRRGRPLARRRHARRPHRPTGVELSTAGEEAARHGVGALPRRAGSTTTPTPATCPALDGTSRMSTYLQVGRDPPAHPAGRPGDSRRERRATYRKELAWREFYADVLLHHARTARGMTTAPRCRRDGLRPAGRGASRRGRRGRTGFPIVDAGMRQLLARPAGCTTGCG